MKRGLIGLLGVILFIAGGVLFAMVSQTAGHACVFVRQLPGGGWECHTATPDDPTYPLAQQMGQLWSPEALVYVNLYLSVLAVSVGVTLMLVCISGLATRDDTKQSGSGRAGWVALLMALLFGVALANVSGQTFPPLDPCWGVLGCPPWNPGPFGPPIGTLLHIARWTVLAILITSVLLSLVGFALTRRTRGTLTPVVVRGLQLAPLLAVTIIGLAALFLFPLPYAL